MNARAKLLRHKRLASTLLPNFSPLLFFFNFISFHFSQAL